MAEQRDLITRLNELPDDGGEKLPNGTYAMGCSCTWGMGPRCNECVKRADPLRREAAARVAELEAACKLENELRVAGSLRELKLMGEVDELRKQLADLRVDRDVLAARLAADHRFSEAPCPICDYNGPGYFQPSTHPCAAMFHAAMDKRNHEANQNELDAAASGALTRAGKDRT